MLTADPIKLNDKLSKSRKPIKTRGAESISSPTQKRAQSLLDREKAIEKSSRLFILLNQQYIGKYGTKNPHSDVNDAITYAIRDFLERDGNPTTNRLKSLEDQVADIGANYRKNVASAKAEKVQQEERKRDEHVQAAIKAERDSYVRPHLTHDEATQWSVLGTVQALSFEEKNEAERRKLEKKGADYRHALKDQIESQREREKREQDERRKQAEEIERIARSVELEEQRKKERSALKFQQERQIIMGQIDEVKKRREQEKREAIEFQQREMARSRRMLEEEEEEKERERQRQKAANDRLITENERDKAKKRLVMEQQRLEEQKMQREYEEKLEREERARSNAFQSRVDALAKIGNSFETTGAGAVARENARKEEHRMLEDIRKKELADKEKEDAKIRKRKQNLQDAQISNRQLVDQKERQKELERAEAQRLREHFQREAEESQRDLRLADERKKEAARNLRNKLDEQMEVSRKSRTRTSKEALTEIELKINQDTIKRIEQDPDLQERIIERLNAAPPRGKNAGFKYG